MVAHNSCLDHTKNTLRHIFLRDGFDPSDDYTLSMGKSVLPRVTEKHHQRLLATPWVDPADALLCRRHGTQVQFH